MTLTQIALLMRREARAGGRAQHKLERGLTLTLWQDGGDWILSLTRKGRPASETEIIICRQWFEIPASAAIEQDRVGQYHIIRLRWSEAAAEQLPLIEPEKPNQYKYD
jgi:hypothetical protein